MPLKGLFTTFRSWFANARLGASRRSPWDVDRDHALDVLAKNGLYAHFYLPAVGVTDPELAAACRELADHGYLIVDRNGQLHGRVAAARPTSDEIAQERRAAYRIVRLLDCNRPVPPAVHTDAVDANNQEGQ